MITTNQENVLDGLDNDIEANETKSIKEDKEDNTDVLNQYGPHDHLLQDHIIITGIPLIAINSKKKADDYEENKDSVGDSPLASRGLFLDKFVRGLWLGSFCVWPAIRICIFYLLTRCEPIGNIFFLEDKDKEYEPEMANWLIDLLYYDPDHATAVWRIVFMADTLLVNVMMWFIFFAVYLNKDGFLCKDTLFGVIYSPIVRSIASFLVMVTMSGDNLCVGLLLSIVTIFLALVGYISIPLLALIGCAFGVAVTAPDVPVLLNFLLLQLQLLMFIYY